MTKVLLYFEAVDGCCESGKHLSQDEMLKGEAIVGYAYLVDKITGQERGDDWNDAPKCCNAGPPNPQTCCGLLVVPVRLGQPFTYPLDEEALS